MTHFGLARKGCNLKESKTSGFFRTTTFHHLMIMSNQTKSPRNGVLCNGHNPAEVDTLFDIADAELNSDKAAHDKWAALEESARRNRKIADPRIKWAAAMAPTIAYMAKRDGFTGFDKSGVCHNIANALAEIWFENQNAAV
jgi:hypothetical protein